MFATWRTAWLIALAAAGLSTASPPRTPPPSAEGGGAAAGASEASPGILSVESRPRVVFAGSLVALSVAGVLLEQVDARIQWSATGGALHYDDLSDVQWRAPTRPGRHRIAVAVESSAGTAHARLDVEVRPASTEGMIWIPEGVFLCGDVEGTRNQREVKTIQNENDEPAHPVYLDGYWIDRYPVTNRQFVKFLSDALEQGMARVEDVAVMGEFEGEWVPFYYLQPYEKMIRGYRELRNARVPRFEHVISWRDGRLVIRKGHASHPVVDVSWFGAAAYADFLGKALPSEAQWEKASRGTDGRRYPWGDNLPTPHHVNLRRELTPVGTYSPMGDSPYGVADMVSPCHEWSSDWFNADYYSDFAAESPHRNPPGTFWGTSHAIRGSPLALTYLVPSVLRSLPTARRYNWRFEFLLGDSFGDRQTTFRTVIPPPLARPPGPEADATNRKQGDP